jgi:hypothetical protein
MRSLARITAILALPAVPALSAAAQAPSDLRGVWRSQGYGLVFAVDDTLLRNYEVTAVSCIPAGTAKPIARQEPGVERAFGEGNDVTLIKSGRGPNEKRLHGEGAASDIVIDRIAALPERCGAPAPKSPTDVFDVFANTWAEHYILFDEKHVDWSRVVAAARPRVTTSTTPTELFDVLSGMIAPFEDAHTFIVAPDISRRFGGMRKGTDRLLKHRGREFLEQDVPMIFAATNRELRDVRNFCNGMIQYAHLDDSTGYLRILGESNYTKEGGFASGLVALEAAYDTIFSDAKLKGLVIDMRVNLGGADPYGLALANRLASHEYLAYSKEARADASDRTKWTPGQASMVRPSSRAGFRGPVVELTGPVTISAGETTTQALMGRRPPVTRVGEHTQGVFSDVLVRHLPNGWIFGLPNEVFRTADGKTFDGPGIPPDVAVPVFTEADLAAGRDPALARARAELWGSR